MTGLTDLAEQVLLIAMWSAISVGAMYLVTMLAVLAVMWWMGE